MARSTTPPERQFDARPDRADFRDKLYEPGLHEVPPLKLPEEWLKLKIPVLDQGQEGACFPAGTRVRLADGSNKDIKDVHTLDRVVTAEGNVGTVLQTMARYFNGSLTQITLRGHTRTFRSTPNHPVLTKRGYVPAENVVVGDLVALPTHTPVGAYEIDVESMNLYHGFRGTRSGAVNTGGVASRVSVLPAKIKKTVALGRLIGLYAAEGVVTQNKVVWCFGSHEEQTLVAETVALIDDVFGAEARLQRRPNNATHVVLYGKPWARLFEVLVPGTAKHGTKRLSSHVTAGSAEYRKALFWGWMHGDGHFRRKSWLGVTVCKALALAVYEIAQDFGLRPTLTARKPVKNKYAKKRQPFWEIAVSQGGGSNSGNSKESDGCFWRKVRLVSREPFSGYVFNMHVEGDESYVADGIGVHNCTGFGLATVANFLLRTRKSHPVLEARVSPRMLYEMAKKYDDWPGESYEGSSARGAVKGWHKHGVCDELDWPYAQDTSVLTLARAAAAADVPLGSYYRVNKADLTAVHAALAEVGVLYVTSQVHTGWDKVGKDGIIPSEPKIDGGHAFALVGYDQDGFWLQNSWGTSWGRKGLARLSYDDWLRDADDAWVCRLGVPVRRTK